MADDDTISPGMPASSSSPQGDEETGTLLGSDVAEDAERLSEEVAELRRQGRFDPLRVRELEHRIASLQASLATLSSQNERLVRTLRDAREQIVTLKSEVDRLGQPPSGYGVVVETFDDKTVDVLTGGRKMHVAVSPTVEVDDLGIGREVMLNEAMNVVAVHGFELIGEVVTIKEVLDDGRVLVVARADDPNPTRPAQLSQTSQPITSCSSKRPP